MKRDSFIFYRSFFEAIDGLPDTTQQNQIYKAIIQYSLDFTEPELEGISKTIWILIKPQLDANIKRYRNGLKGAEHGAKGGRPKTPKKPQDNPKETPNLTPNVNVNVNENVNITVGELITYSLSLNKDNLFDAKKLELLAVDAFEHYSQSNWVQKNGNPIKKPKLVFYNNWFKSARERGELFPRIGDGLSPVLT